MEIMRDVEGKWKMMREVMVCSIGDERVGDCIREERRRMEDDERGNGE
jgi:hypothetical protein